MLQEFEHSEFSQRLPIAFRTQSFEGAVDPGSVPIGGRGRGLIVVFDVFGEEPDGTVAHQKVSSARMSAVEPPRLMGAIVRDPVDAVIGNPQDAHPGRLDAGFIARGIDLRAESQRVGRTHIQIVVAEAAFADQERIAGSIRDLGEVDGRVLISDTRRRSVGRGIDGGRCAFAAAGDHDVVRTGDGEPIGAVRGHESVVPFRILIAGIVRQGLVEVVQCRSSIRRAEVNS